MQVNIVLKPEKLTKTQKRKTVDLLFETSAPDFEFFFMLLLSTVIISLGMLLNNAAVIIGGMLVAPLLFPILSLAMGLVVGDVKLMKRSGITIIYSVLVVMVIAFLISLLYVNKEVSDELLSRVQPSLSYFLIAVFSGLAAAYAMARPDISEILPGIAITVALAPPLTAVGIALSFFSWSMMVGALGLFFLNLLGIVFASLIVFAILRFYEVKEVIEKKIKAEEKGLKAEQKVKEEEDLQELQKTVQKAAKILEEKNHNNSK